MKLEKRHPLQSLGVIPALRGDIRVEKLEDRMTPKVPFPHKHDFFQIVFIVKGSGWHEVDFTRYKVAPHQVYTIKPGQVHGWELSKKTQGFIVEFTEDSLQQSHWALSLRTLRQLPDCAILKKLSLDFLKQMEFEFREKPLHFALALQHFLNILLLFLIRETSQTKVLFDKNESLSDAFIELIEKNYRKEHGLAFYAAQLKSSAKNVSANTQKYLGKPAKEILQERILLEAQRLLVFSNLTAAEICYELGFEDPNYFSRFMKQSTGLTALEYRRQNKKT